MTPEQLAALRQQYRTDLADAQGLAAKATRTEAEARRLDTLIGPAETAGSLKALKGQIEAGAAAVKALQDAADWAAAPAPTVPFPGRPAARESAPADAGTADDDAATKGWKISTGDAEVDKRYPTGGFKSLGHFSYTLINAAKGSADPGAIKSIHDWQALAFKAASGMGITADPTADILVPMQFSQQIYSRMQQIDDIFGKCDQLTIRGNAIRLPAWDDSSRADAYRHGGVQAYWQGEGVDATPTKVDKTRYMDFRLHKLMAYVVLSSELLEDSEFVIDQVVDAKASEAITFKLSQAAWEGDGVGKPVGAFRPSSTIAITVTKESGQAADTVATANIHKMFSRVNKVSRGNLTWHINNDVEPALQDLVVGQTPVYYPPGGLAQSPYGMLKGRPVLVTEFSETIGDLNDIVAADWRAYQYVVKGQTRRDISLHARFLQDEQAMRFVFRADGQPKWDKPLTPLKGSTTTSPFVNLQAR